MYWDVVGELSIGATPELYLSPNPPNLTPKIEDSQNSSFKKYDQSAADGVTLSIEVVSHSGCNCTKIFSGFALMFAG